MIRPALRTVLIGAGKVGAGYADDPLMARFYPYATHAQVLADHPAFDWVGLVDPAESVRISARAKWGVPCAVATMAELGDYQPEVAVLATPPDSRLDLLAQLPSLRAVIVEKPLGHTLEESVAFLDHCHRSGIRVQVNLWRRADEAFRRLANGGLVEAIGRPQTVFGVFGNGLRNNGTHMVDFIRMLLGEVEIVQAFGPTELAGPLAGDAQMAVHLQLSNGVVAALHPVQFEHYRENSLDIWGEQGRLLIAQEGLSLQRFPRVGNRAMTGEREVASDQPEALASTVGHAFYRLYDNLASSLWDGTPLWSDGTSALQTERLIDLIVSSARQDGRALRLSPTVPEPLEILDAH